MKFEAMGDQALDTKREEALGRSLASFVRQKGKALEARVAPCHQWLESRREFGLYPYGKVLMGEVAGKADVADEFRRHRDIRTNFGSQDYLALAQDQRLCDAVVKILKEVGVHSAGSPALCGKTNALVNLEESLASVLGMEECLVFPTAWTAGFGVLAGLVRNDDMILMDSYSHNCLFEGARHATANICKFMHNDLSDLEELLRSERAQNADGGIFIVLESLYSMDSDSPDLATVMRMARAHEAIVILDIAHDFGACGSRGLGLLESIASDLWPDVIMGSFSKTFAATGGFIACSRPVKDYLKNYCSPYVFSNAISPMQTAVVTKAMEIVFSEEGSERRKNLRANISALRAALERESFKIGGEPSPIVPVYVGDEKRARLVSKEIGDLGLLANLVEFPAVPQGHARFRFQVMSSHTGENIDEAVRIMKEAIREVETNFL